MHFPLLFKEKDCRINCLCKQNLQGQCHEESIAFIQMRYPVFQQATQCTVQLTVFTFFRSSVKKLHFLKLLFLCITCFLISRSFYPYTYSALLKFDFFFSWFNSSKVQCKTRVIMRKETSQVKNTKMNLDLDISDKFVLY